MHHGAKDGRGRPIHSGLVRVAAARLDLEAVLVRGGPLSEGLRPPPSNPLKPMAARARLRGIEPVRRDPQTVIHGHHEVLFWRPDLFQRGQRGLQTTQGRGRGRVRGRLRVMDEKQGRNARFTQTRVRQQDRWIKMQGLTFLNRHGAPLRILTVDRLTKLSKGFHPVVAEGSGRGFADGKGQAPCIVHRGLLRSTGHDEVTLNARQGHVELAGTLGLGLRIAQSFRHPPQAVVRRGQRGPRPRSSHDQIGQDADVVACFLARVLTTC